MLQDKEIKTELEKYKAIDVAVKSEGGQILQEALRKELLAIIDQISTKHKTISHIELV